MGPDATGAALWGVVGGLAFLVLALGYRLLTPARPEVSVLAVVAVVVTVVAAVASYGLERLLSANGRP